MEDTEKEEKMKVVRMTANHRKSAGVGRISPLASYQSWRIDRMLKCTEDKRQYGDRRGGKCKKKHTEHWAHIKTEWKGLIISTVTLDFLENMVHVYQCILPECELALAVLHVYCFIPRLVKVFSSIGHSTCSTKSLPKRSCGHIHKLLFLFKKTNTQIDIWLSLSTIFKL